MPETRVFDQPHYQSIDEARKPLLREVLSRWKQQLGLQTAIDVGCGAGHFSVLLRDLGFQLMAIDGRQDNVEEARRRCPGIEIQTADVEDSALAQLGAFDLVLCLGLLYHLENPFRSIRNLRELTSKLLVIESMCTTEELPVLHLREEGPTEDQGLRHIAFYPSEACLVKMLYKAEFSSVFRFCRMPDHEDFRATHFRRQARTMLVASREPFRSGFLTLLGEPAGVSDPWTRPWAKAWEPVQRLGHLMAKPWPWKMEKIRKYLG